uniref:hypothetical protein n=1 Tax=Herbidospora sakaeratensis TaxID=564415 RepID=UPI0007861BEF|nr:hypothetical protein [Herbidospora sakaeratensis]
MNRLTASLAGGLPVTGAMSAVILAEHPPKRVCRPSASQIFFRYGSAWPAPPAAARRGPVRGGNHPLRCRAVTACRA